jgi:hypothetical protein
MSAMRPHLVPHQYITMFNRQSLICQLISQICFMVDPISPYFRELVLRDFTGKSLISDFTDAMLHSIKSDPLFLLTQASCQAAEQVCAEEVDQCLQNTYSLSSR